MQIQVQQYYIETLKEINMSGFSHIYFESTDSDFLEEVKKYECPIRFTLFLNKNKGKFKTIYKDYFIPKYNDIELNFSFRHMEYTADIYHNLILNGEFEKFVEMTPEYNRYGKVGF